MRVLVTGGAGFIGSNLVDELLSLGYEVDIWDNLVTGKQENINPEANFLEIDCLEGRLRNLRPYEVIFHLAAMPRVEPSLKNPKYSFQNNILTTEAICEIATNCRARVVYAGTSCFYGGVYENPYAFTKWVGEETCKLFNKIYGVPVAIARFFNVYGDRQIKTGDYSTIVGIFEDQFAKGSEFTITDDGEQRRDFINVKDIVTGLIAMSKDDWNGEVFNLGMGENYSINELAQMFNNPKGIRYIPKREGEARETLADINFTLDKLDWKPECRLQQYVDNFVQNYRMTY